ncbi:MAG TPA: cbb3-type cytochrome c oxidase subunit 3 [Rhodobacterales bacterium]|nr:cbb3-type cytochrome c oxidase subunit 3 [Rhodobacterales bacterium]
MQDTYSFLRAFADSWVMLGMLAFFLGVVFWAFRPGSTKVYADTANIPFRHEDKPAGEGNVPAATLKEGHDNG